MKRPGETKSGQVFPIEEKADFMMGDIFDFDIEDDILKPAHKAYLDKVIKFMQDNLAERQRDLRPGEQAWTVSLDGFASRTGQAAFNTHLSARREIAAEEYLVGHMSRGLLQVVKIDRNFHGFNDTVQAGEVAIARSVRVAVHRPGLKVQPRPLPRLPETREYLIRMSFAGAATLPVIGLGGDLVRFKIADRKAGRMASFSYTGASLSLPGTPITLTTGGPSTTFKTSTPVHLADFNGPASFGSAPSAGLSIADSQLKLDSPTLLQNGVRIIPRIIPINTGTTFGASFGSASEGALLFDGEEEFTVDKFEK